MSDPFSAPCISGEKCQLFIRGKCRFAHDRSIVTGPGAVPWCRDGEDCQNKDECNGRHRTSTCRYGYRDVCHLMQQEGRCPYVHMERNARPGPEPVGCGNTTRVILDELVAAKMELGSRDLLDTEQRQRHAHVAHQLWFLHSATANLLAHLEYVMNAHAECSKLQCMPQQQSEEGITTTTDDTIAQE